MRRVRPWLGPVCGSAFVLAGDFKGEAIFARLPLDLTLFLALITMGTVAVSVLRWRSVPSAALSMMTGFAFLAPAALWAPRIPYAHTKIVYVLTLTLLAAVAPVVIIRRRGDVRRWIVSYAGIRVSMRQGHIWPLRSHRTKALLCDPSRMTRSFSR